MYRVTPVFDRDNLLADGVVMEAESVEDGGAGLRFCVYVYNVQPGVEIDYATGESWETRDSASSALESQAEEQEADYVLNTSSKKFHLPECSGARDMKESNRQDYQGNRDQLLEQGYTPCGLCHP